MAQYVVVWSSSLPATRSEFVVFDKCFDWLHLYIYFDYWEKETILERQLTSRGNSCCVINWCCAHFYDVSPLVCSGLFAPVQEWGLVMKIHGVFHDDA